MCVPCMHGCVWAPSSGKSATAHHNRRGPHSSGTQWNEDLCIFVAVRLFHHWHVIVHKRILMHAICCYHIVYMHDWYSRQQAVCPMQLRKRLPDRVSRSELGLPASIDMQRAAPTLHACMLTCRQLRTGQGHTHLWLHDVRYGTASYVC
jgi:hypothetical protein